MKKLKNNIREKLGNDFFELLDHGKNYVTADILAKGLAFISIPIFTRLLTPEEYGVLAVFNSFVAVFVVVFGLGVRGAVGRYFYDDKTDFKEYFGSSFTFILIWSVFLSILLSIFNNYLSNFFNLSETLIYIGILVAFFSSTFEILQSYLEASKQSKLFSKLNIIRSISILCCSIPITYFLNNNREYGQVIGQLLVYFSFFVFSTHSILKISKAGFKKKHIKFSLLFGIPLVFHLLSQFVLATFDQIIISQLVGEKETGLYSFAYQIGMIQNIIAMAILRAWTPVFYEKLNAKLFSDIDSLIKKYSKMIYMLAFVLIIFSKELVVLLADIRYSSSLEIVPIVIISYVLYFFYVIYVGYSFYHKKTYLIAIFTVLAGIINISLNYIFIPKYGYQVAAVTTLISYLFLFCFHYLNSKFIIKTEKIIQLKTLLPNFLLLVLTVFMFFWIKRFLENYLLILIIKIVLLSLITVIMYKNIIFQKKYNGK